MSGLGQHIEYAQNFIAQVDAQHARDVARESAMSSDKTRKNTERLYLVVQAMWELLKYTFSLALVVAITSSDIHNI